MMGEKLYRRDAHAVATCVARSTTTITRFGGSTLAIRYLQLCWFERLQYCDETIDKGQ